MSIASILKHADIFYELSPTQLELIASICTEKEYNKGEVIFDEHGASDELFVVAEGEIDIQVDPTIVNIHDKNVKGPQTIATFRRWQSFGEMALLDEGRRSASARASESGVKLIAIPRDKLISLCETYPQLGYRLMFNLAVDLSIKIRNADLQIREQLLWAHNPSNQEES